MSRSRSDEPLRNSQGWAAAFDWQRLSPRSQETIERIARPLAEHGYTHAELAEQLGLDPSEISEAMRELEAEARGRADGALLPPLTEVEEQALRDSLAELGQLIPVLVDEHGEALDGSNRLRLLQELGLEVETRTIDTGGDPERRHAIRLATNTVRRTLSAAARRSAIEAELPRAPDRSDRSISALLGVANHTVAAVREELEARGTLLRLERRRGKDGVARRRPKPRPSKPAVPEAPTPTGAAGIQIRMELDPGDTAGGRLGFTADDLRLLVTERAWIQLGRPLALEVTVDPLAVEAAA